MHGAIVPVVTSPTCPKGYPLTAKGDSGSLWLEADTGRAVALHYAGNAAGLEFSDSLYLEDAPRSIGMPLCW